MEKPVLETEEFGPLPLKVERVVNQKGDPIRLAEPTEYWTGERVWNPETLTIEIQGEPFINPSNWGLMMLPYKAEWGSLGARMTSRSSAEMPTGSLTPAQLFARQKVEEEAKTVGNKGLTWFYSYDTQINDLTIMAEYNSAFAQSVIIHGLLYQAEVEQNDDLVQMAIKAADNMIAPISEGGLTSIDGDIAWYQEIPLPPGLEQYILNGHIYSVNVLYLLGQRTGLTRFTQAAERGAASLDTQLYAFDTGYWTRYDLRPRYMMMLFELLAENTDVRSIRLTLNNKKEAKDASYTICNRRFIFTQQTCDQTLTEARNGTRYAFVASIPALARYFPAQHSNLDLKITFKGDPPEVVVPGFRPSLQERIVVRPTRVKRRVASYKVGMRDLGWHAPDELYQEYHAMLMADLYQWRPRPEYFVTASRWSNYLRVLRNESANDNEIRSYEERDGETLPFRHRRFEPIRDDALDARIAACFEGVDPLKLTLDVFEAKAKSCADDHEALEQIASRLGFIVHDGSIGDGARWTDVNAIAAQK